MSSNFFDNTKLAPLFERACLNNDLIILIPIAYIIGEVDEKGTSFFNYADQMIYVHSDMFIYSNILLLQCKVVFIFDAF